MKKIIISVIIIISLLIPSLNVIAKTDLEEQIFFSEKITCSKPIIVKDDEYLDIELAEATTTWKVGLPMIPVVKKTYTFPFGTEINSVKLSYSERSYINLDKPIRPASEFYETNIQGEINIEEKNFVSTIKETAIYPQNSNFYKTRAGLKDGQHVIYLTISAFPVLYHPNKDMISYSNDVKIDISYSINNEEFFPFQEFDLLIICPEKYVSKLENLADFNQKLEEKINTKIVSLDDIYNSVYFNVKGIDEQENIKYFIKDAIENWGIINVLLVGSGVKGDEDFPVRYAWIKSQPYEVKFASDLYFADIYDSEGKFSDWDYDDDGMYAEVNNNKNDLPAIDFLPDVYLGKLPVNSLSELDIIINKIIKFRKYNNMNYKILQAGGDTFPVQYGDESGIYEGEYLNSKILEELTGYSSIKLSGSNRKLSKYNIAKAINDGVDYIDFSGHGWHLRWCTYVPNDPSIWLPRPSIISPSFGWLNADFNLYNVNTNKLFVAFFNGCCTSKYTEIYNCLSWRAISYPKGGIASFGSTGIAFCGVGEESSEKAMGKIAKNTFKELYNSKSLGEAWSNSIVDYVNEFGPDFDKIDCKTLFEFVLFGDPTLVIEDGFSTPPANIDETLISNKENSLELNTKQIQESALESILKEEKIFLN